MTVASVKPEVYRYLDEALDVIAQHALSLQQVLVNQEAEGQLTFCWDGTLIHTDAVASGKVTDHNDADNSDDSPTYKTIGLFSGKHWCFSDHSTSPIQQKQRTFIYRPGRNWGNARYHRCGKAYFRCCRGYQVMIFRRNKPIKVQALG